VDLQQWKDLVLNSAGLRLQIPDRSIKLGPRTLYLRMCDGKKGKIRCRGSLMLAGWGIVAWANRSRWCSPCSSVASFAGTWEGHAQLVEESLNWTFTFFNNGLFSALYPKGDWNTCMLEVIRRGFQIAFNYNFSPRNLNLQLIFNIRLWPWPAVVELAPRFHESIVTFTFFQDASLSTSTHTSHESTSKLLVAIPQW
jgi:hypothetical protein